jgi:hypothetical protein
MTSFSRNTTPSDIHDWNCLCDLNAPVKETAMMTPKAVSEKRSKPDWDTRTGSYGCHDFGAAPF